MAERLYPPFEHEYDIRAYIRGLLGGSKGGVFIDVGANVGVWTIDLAPLFDKVYAVEPWYADQLCLNIKDYGVDNVEVIEAAAWDFNGMVLIGISRVDNLISGIRADVPKVGLSGKLVKSIRLDNVIKEPFRLLKIDVEGEAMHVLRGMDRLLRESNGIAVIEVHNHGESHGTYLYMVERGWRLEKTLRESTSGDLYHAHKVYVK